MKTKILSILSALIITTSISYAHDYHPTMPHKPTYKEQRQMDKFLIETLNLSEAQQDELKQNRTKHRREMNKIVNDMEKLHIKIRDIYFSGIPKFQADLKSAPMKAELVILKQNADKLRKEHRRTFENILTQEQKIKFESIKKEMARNKQK